jgi:branched-chain amino acid transport system substrate-binding protein
MTQRNETPALVVSLLITAGLLGGGFWFLRSNTQLIPFRLPVGQSQNLDELRNRISYGDRILLPSESANAQFNQLKQAGVNAMNAKQFENAMAMFDSALKTVRNAPETLIYLNNARIGARKAYVIAVPVPIKTDLAGSAEILRGVAQAQNEVNQAGGIKGTPLKIAIASDDNDPDTAEKLADAFVQDPDILGVVGHYASDVTLAAASVYNSGKLVMISPISSTVKLSGFGRYVFRTVPSDYVAARALADYATKTLQSKNVAVFFNSQSAYSESLKQEFSTAIALSGGQVSTEVDFSNSTFNAKNAVEQALNQGATTLMLAANTSVLDKAMQVVQANQKRAKLLGGDDVYTPRTLQEGHVQAVDMVVAVPWHIEANLRSPFVVESRQLWAADVNWRSAIAYDATQAFVAGMLQDPTREGVHQTICGPEFSVSGASQAVKFLPSGDRNTSVQLVKIVPGKRSGTGFDFVPLTSN